MLAEYVQLDELIKQRAAHIGKLLREHRHFAACGHAVPIASPYLSQITEGYMHIAAGYSSNGALCAVVVPAPLVENGSDADIRKWIDYCNTEHAKSDLDIQNEEIETRRVQELSILRELLARYPEEIQGGN